MAPCWQCSRASCLGTMLGEYAHCKYASNDAQEIYTSAGQASRLPWAVFRVSMATCCALLSGSQVRVQGGCTLEAWENTQIKACR
eukprot:scaffold3908_cov22-Tisochrysis_lutea.AAC.1